MATTLKVHDYLANGKALRRVARDVRPDEIQTDAFQQFVQDMSETLFRCGGLGLAATQVDASAPDGSVWRLFVMRGPFANSGNPNEWICVANPRIVKALDPEWGLEGCLSFRGVGATMLAPTEIHARHMNEDGRSVNITCNGSHARCYAHEEEHLRGRLLVDRMNRAERERFLRAVAKQARAAA